MAKKEKTTFLKITQIRSGIGRKEVQKKTLKALGLGRIGKSRVHRDTPQIRGMVDSISHLLSVEQVEK